MDLTGVMEQDVAEQSPVPRDEQLKIVASLIQQQVAMEEEVDHLEYQLSEAKAKLYKLSEVDIPSKFQELGLSVISLSDGSKVEIKPYYAANISAENHDKAFEWLRIHGLDDIIKHEVKVVFGRGEETEFENLAKTLQELNVNYIDKEQVHPQTLKAIVREQVEKMSEQEDKIPFDLFSVHIGHKTKITRRRK